MFARALPLLAGIKGRLQVGCKAQVHIVLIGGHETLHKAIFRSGEGGNCLQNVPATERTIHRQQHRSYVATQVGGEQPGSQVSNSVRSMSFGNTVTDSSATRISKRSSN